MDESRAEVVVVGVGVGQRGDAGRDKTRRDALNKEGKSGNVIRKRTRSVVMRVR